MKKIIAINGSPKPRSSASGILINQTGAILGTTLTVYQATQLLNQESAAETLADILKADTLLIVFPLYIDALPAPLIKVFMLLEQEAVKIEGKLPKVYAICNCGFYEAENNRLAFDIIKNFCIRSGLVWGYGIGIGAGGSLHSPYKDMSQGPLANIYAALSELVKSMQEHSSLKQNLFLTAEIPRSEYLLDANKAWEEVAEKYGQQTSLRARPHIR